MADGANNDAGGRPVPAYRAAAVHVERGVERYAEGAYDEAVIEFETALVAQPGHARALECLGWTREVQDGRRTLFSGGFSLVDAAPTAEQTAPGEVPVQAAVPVQAVPPPPPIAQAPPPGRTMFGLPAIERMQGGASGRVPQASSNQSHDEPDSVTREWSTMATGRGLPQLDVPELSEEQIANLLEAGGGRGLTLSKGASPAVAPSPPTPRPPDAPRAPSVIISASHVIAAAPPERSSDDDEEDEQDKTRVRLEGRVVEFIADAEDDTPLPGRIPVGISSAAIPIELDPLPSEPEPLLPPLESGVMPAIAASISSAGIPSIAPDPNSQLGDDPSSLPTNPFVTQRLREFAQPLMPQTDASGLHRLPPVPAIPTGGGWAEARVALDRGSAREAFDAVERMVIEGGGLDAGRAVDEHALLGKVYEAVVGDLRGVPRFGKATPDLDSRSAFLLSRMDGSLTADDLLDVSGMPRFEALRVLAQLVVAGVVTFTK